MPQPASDDTWFNLILIAAGAAITACVHLVLKVVGKIVKAGTVTPWEAREQIHANKAAIEREREEREKADASLEMRLDTLGNEVDEMKGR